MEQLTREGVALAFEDVGKGAPPILLIHDLGRDHTSLQPQLEYFRRRHRVVAVDLRGHGQSDRLVQPYTLAGHAEDLVWLCSELGVYRPVAVGQGVGGMIAVELAARWPDLLAAVVALDGLPARQSAANARAQGSAQPEAAVVAVANQDALWEHAMTPISPAAGHFLALRTAAVGRGSAVPDPLSPSRKWTQACIETTAEPHVLAERVLQPRFSLDSAGAQQSCLSSIMTDEAVRLLGRA